MIRWVGIFLLSFAALFAHAGETVCAKLAAQIDGPSDNFRPPLEGTVIGNGKLNFYSAPSAECQIKGVTAAPGNYLTIYKPYQRWVNVMFIAKNGENVIGWVPKDRIKIAGQYGNNP